MRRPHLMGNAVSRGRSGKEWNVCGAAVEMGGGIIDEHWEDNKLVVRLWKSKS